MAMKKIITLFLLIIFISACSMPAVNAINKTVKLKLIKYDGDIVLMNIDANTEKIALAKMKVVKIEGLEKLPRLKELSLQFFYVDSLDWIPKSIKKLNLTYNELKSIDGIEDFICLEEVILLGNQIRNIDDIFKNNSIKRVYCAVNEIEVVNCSNNNSIELLYLTSNKIEHIRNLNKLKKLKYISLAGNPIENDRTEIKRLQEENPSVEISAKESK